MLTSILQQRTAWQVLDAGQRLTEPAELSDAAGYASWVDLPGKLRLLQTTDPAERLQFLLERGRAHLAELDVADRIREDVREGMDRTQREYLLRQQLAAVREADRLERTPDGSPEGGWIRTCLELAGGRGSGAVLVLLGPPGVGKTSLGESVARALGRAFVRVGPSAGSATRPRSAGTVAPTWVRCPGGSSAPSRRPAR